jgi:general secretion pathway protein G
MKKVLKKRTGFTLVELLIVIIIIGILAGAMLLVAGSGTDKAEATKIVSDLRSLKAAALMYYADHPSETDAPDVVTSLDKYMDRTLTAEYICENSGDAEWYIGRVANITDNVKLKLKDSAESSGLLNGSTTAPTGEAFDGATSNWPWMRAR